MRSIYAPPGCLSLVTAPAPAGQDGVGFIHNIDVVTAPLLAPAGTIRKVFPDSRHSGLYGGGNTDDTPPLAAAGRKATIRRAVGGLRSADTARRCTTRLKRASSPKRVYRYASAGKLWPSRLWKAVTVSPGSPAMRSVLIWLKPHRRQIKKPHKIVLPYGGAQCSGARRRSASGD